MAKQVVLTAEGLESLKNEFETLKNVTRQEIADKLELARSYGDLSENSEYDEAKNEQAKVEARITEIEAMLKNVKVIDEADIVVGSVGIGSRVTVLDVEFDETETYSIVGSAEADPMNGKISDESPVGRALIGHSVDEIVIAETPSGELRYKILEISR
jgi:transcription elongation factor GreA